MGLVGLRGINGLDDDQEFQLYHQQLHTQCGQFAAAIQCSIAALTGRAISQKIKNFRSLLTPNSLEDENTDYIKYNASSICAKLK